MIIVYGGTFNPPTIAHLKITKKLIKKFKPEKLVLLPVGDNYTWKDKFVSFNNRKNMLDLIFNDDIYEISDIENSKEYKGSYWALNKIKDTYKKDVYFVIGADNFEQLDKWISYEKLLSEFKLIILTRKGYTIDSIIDSKYNKYQDNFIIVDVNYNISSTEFRSNPNLKHLLDEKVYQYIKENNLYEVNDA